MDGRKRFEHVTCGRVFFLKTEKNISLLISSGYVCTEPKNLNEITDALLSRDLRIIVFLRNYLLKMLLFIFIFSIWCFIDGYDIKNIIYKWETDSSEDGMSFVPLDMKMLPQFKLTKLHLSTISTRYVVGK